MSIWSGDGVRICSQSVTQRPEKHKIAGKAVSAVSDVIAHANHAPEEIKNDYGEDLLVQTSHKDQMDASRLWFQVKGTANIESHRLKGGGLRYRISFDHALRWIRTVDLVVFVLWDVVNHVGWYAIPRDQVDAYEGITKMKKGVTLRFDEQHLLDEEAVDTLVWRSRLEHHRLLVLSAQEAEQDSRNPRKGTRSEDRVLTALDFTDLIGVTERRIDLDGVQYQVSPDIWEEFQHRLNSLPKGSDSDDEGANLYRVAYEIVYGRWKRIDPRLALPSVLIKEGGEVILDIIFRELENKETMAEVEKLVAKGRATGVFPWESGD
jgi:hypothetical protein